jgi:hypothetical protein
MIRQAMRTSCAVATLGVVGLLLMATPASATLIKTHEVIGSFDGTGSTGSQGAPKDPFVSPFGIGIEQATNTVYISDPYPGPFYGGAIDKFSASGSPVAFSGLEPGVTSVPTGELGLSIQDLPVDNSGTASEGQFYDQGYILLYAHRANGEEIKGHFPIQQEGSDCGIAVDPEGNIWWSSSGKGLIGYDSTGTPLNKTIGESVGAAHGNCTVAIDQSKTSETSGYFYIATGEGVYALDSSGTTKYVIPRQPNSIAVDPSTGDIYLDEGNIIYQYAPSIGSSPGELISTYGNRDPKRHFEGLCSSSSVGVMASTHYVYATERCNGHVYIFGPAVEYVIPTVVTEAAEVQATSATLRAHVDPENGGDLTECRFEWSTNENYGEIEPCSPGAIHSGDGNTLVTANINGLTPGTIYHYRLVASNENAEVKGTDVAFKPHGKPVIGGEFTHDVNSDGAQISAEVNPDGVETTYHFEYGPDTSYGERMPNADVGLKSPTKGETTSAFITGLTPNTTYHFRVSATNESGTTFGGDHTFTTFALYAPSVDPCGNAQERRQTGASLLFDCRSYELASASYSGGYDVESDLIPGQSPLVAHPEAPNRVLYSLHYGTIPGVAGDPPNIGLDPYVAERGPEGWTTRYVGIAAEGTPSTKSFGSPLLAADRSLSTFAFGGESLCDPCFSDGSTGVPVRLANGALEQGMSGDIAAPEAEPSGYVANPLSADGTHLVFGSKTPLESDGRSGEVSIYDRNLNDGVTDVVSKTPSGETMKEEGEEIGEFGISGDGSRIVFGRLVSSPEHPGGEDSAGNRYWHLYMNVGDASKSIDLTPGTSGVLYDGMTSDGSKVFFSTSDQLLPGDQDESADIYRADVSSSSSSLTLVSSGGTGSGCTPVASKGLEHWNSVSGEVNCDAVGLAGGGGVASQDGSIYFLSPERLDGNGTAGAPNLFVARPGSAPHFIASLSPEDQAVRDAVLSNGAHSYRDFQVTPSGSDAVFATIESPTGYINLGRYEIYRYDSPSDHLDCVSCPTTEASPRTDTVLSSIGLNLADDGRVFFTSAEPLVLRDTDKLRDAYEWENGVIELISTGRGNNGAGLLSVSANGTDAFFFTRQVITAEDHNGTSMKIYDARAGGGYFADITPPPCQASDECHGPGSQEAPPPQIATLEGDTGNQTGGRGASPCRKHFVRKHGKCVKETPKHHGTPRHKNARKKRHHR